MEKGKRSYEEIFETEEVIFRTNKGVSMMPLLREDRDIMLIRRRGAERCKKYDAVLFKRDSGQYVMHRILKVRPRDYWIVGDNCVGGEYVREDQILGVLTGVIRGRRRIDVNSPGYLLYVHLWCDAYPVRFFILKVFHRMKRLVKK